VCDEPVSALDVSVQAAVLDLLMEIQRAYDTTILFIAHDLGVVRFLCDQVLVMYLGRICEIGPADAVFAPPYHPYTEALLSAIPIPDPAVGQSKIRLQGAPPSAIHPPGGCHFHPRCPRKVGRVCEVERPPKQQAGPDHYIHCHQPLEVLRAVHPVLTASVQTGGTR
jgi:peptide/nickel transport system ATP-binding protein